MCKPVSEGPLALPLGLANISLQEASSPPDCDQALLQLLNVGDGNGQVIMGTVGA